jgi:hypothetical protein
MLGLHPYDPHAVLAQTDAHTAIVLALCALALIGNYIMWIENLRLGSRARLYPMPAVCILFFLSHDLTFVASYHTWFHEFDHWFPKLWWYGLILTCLMELAFLGLWLKFARTEVAPQLSRCTFTLATLAALAATTIAWLVIKSTMNDPLYLIIFGFTVFFCGPWYLALMWRRQSDAGQSIVGWLGYLMMPIFYWPATAILSPTFRSPLWIAFGVITALFGLANIGCIHYLRANQYRGTSLPSSADQFRDFRSAGVGGPRSGLG